MFKKPAWITLLYGLALIFLGYAGYAQAQSLASLGMGGAFGLLMVISSIALFQSKKWGYYTGIGSTFLLTGFFAVRFFLSGKMVPGALTFLTLFVFLYLLSRIKKGKEHHAQGV